VDQVLLEDPLVQLLAREPRPLVLREVRRALDAIRDGLRTAGAGAAVPGAREVALDAVRRVSERPRGPRRVLNATGVVLHTNLGRARLADEVAGALVEVARGACDLEIDLETGRRSSRGARVEQRLVEITGAPAALVVNNNAGALVLALNELAQGREAVVSRGELVEIGGSFRLPDVMADGRAPRRGGHDESHAPRGLRARDRTADRDPLEGPPLELPSGRLRRVAGPEGPRRARARPRSAAPA
jgi:L-seryl-tRNA(Ser) seleniumtransferase